MEEPAARQEELEPWMNFFAKKTWKTVHTWRWHAQRAPLEGAESCPTAGEADTQADAVRQLVRCLQKVARKWTGPQLLTDKQLVLWQLCTGPAGTRSSSSWLISERHVGRKKKGWSVWLPAARTPVLIRDPYDCILFLESAVNSRSVIFPDDAWSHAGLAARALTLPRLGERGAPVEEAD